MKSYSLLILALIAAVAAYEEPLIYYHSAAGIETAKKIKQYEEGLDFSGGRIAGGTTASADAHPHLGGLLITLQSGGQSVCGSSMLSNTRAVTAAHCWNDGQNRARQLTVVYGSTRLFTGGTRINSNNVQMHASFNIRSLVNDIAIIIHSRVGYTNIINRINIASGSNLFVGQTATAAGYGRTSQNTPVTQATAKRHVTMPVITNAVCAQTFGTTTIVRSTICTSGAGGRSICPGDSGGPLSVGSGNNRILIGVSSFVSRAGCTSGNPAGFARVSEFNAWIRQRL